VNFEIVEHKRLLAHHSLTVAQTFFSITEFNKITRVVTCIYQSGGWMV